jgi:hypothetical protein
MVVKSHYGDESSAKQFGQRLVEEDPNIVYVALAKHICEANVTVEALWEN